MVIPLRGDFDAVMLRAIAKQTKEAAQARRLLALAAVYKGSTRTQAAAIDGVTLQIVRDWVLKFNADGLDGLIDRKPPVSQQGSWQTNALAAGRAKRALGRGAGLAAEDFPGIAAGENLGGAVSSAR